MLLVYLGISVKTNHFMFSYHIIFIKFPRSYAVNFERQSWNFKQNNVFWEHLLVVYTVWKNKYVLANKMIHFVVGSDFVTEDF